MKRLLAYFLIFSMLTATMLATGCAETEQPDETTEAPADSDSEEVVGGENQLPLG